MRNTRFSFGGLTAALALSTTIGLSGVALAQVSVPDLPKADVPALPEAPKADVPALPEAPKADSPSIETPKVDANVDGRNGDTKAGVKVDDGGVKVDSGTGNTKAGVKVDESGVKVDSGTGNTKADVKVDDGGVKVDAKTNEADRLKREERRDDRRDARDDRRDDREDRRDEARDFRDDRRDDARDDRRDAREDRRERVRAAELRTRLGTRVNVRDNRVWINAFDNNALGMRAGMRMNDEIYSINGHEIHSEEDFNTQLEAATEGTDPVTIRYRRDGRFYDTRVMLTGSDNDGRHQSYYRGVPAEPVPGQATYSNGCCQPVYVSDCGCGGRRHHRRARRCR